MPAASPAFMARMHCAPGRNVEHIISHYTESIMHHWMLHSPGLSNFLSGYPLFTAHFSKVISSGCTLRQVSMSTCNVTVRRTAGTTNGHTLNTVSVRREPPTEGYN